MVISRANIISVSSSRVVVFCLLLRECRHCRYTFVTFPWKLAGHIRSNPSIYLVTNSVALSSELYINFIKDLKAAILDLQMACKGTNLTIYPLTLLHSNISRIPIILSLRHNK